MLLHPQIAARTCEECLKWWYVADKVEPITVPAIGGNKQRRPLMVDPPCGSCPKIPDDGPKTRFRAIEWSNSQWAAYRHYKRCKAVGRFEDDEAVEAVAEAVAGVEEAATRARDGAGQQRLLSILKMTAMMGKKR